MPPVFGPSSPSRARLKSCAGSSGAAVVPSASAKRLTSGPSRYSSMTTFAQLLAWALASARSVVTTTPLPAASASSFTTYGGPNSRSASSAAACVVATRDRAVGIPARAMTSFANALDPSMRAALLFGPKAAIPFARSSSATPATSGASGPMTTRSALTRRASRVTSPGSVALTSWQAASSAMPGLPGAACNSPTAGSLLSARTIACSRPPDPITSTRTLPPWGYKPTPRTPHPLGCSPDRSKLRSLALASPRGPPSVKLQQRIDLDRLVAAGADADRADLRAGHLLDRPDVGARGGGEVLEHLGGGDVLNPAVQVLVDRLGMVELGLRHRDVVVPLAVHVIGDADRDLVEAGQHVELGDEQVGDAVHPGGVPRDHRVEPAGAPGSAGGHAELAAGRAQPLAGRVVELSREGPGADPRGVGLDDADHLADVRRADAGADAGAARRRVGGGDERVRAVIHVKQRPLRAFQQHAGARVQRLADHQASVGDIGLEPLGITDELLRDPLGLDAAPVVDLSEELVLIPQGQLQLLRQDAGVEQVLDPDADAGHLVRVGGANAAPRGTDLGLAEEPLGHLVQCPVVRHDQVRVGTDQQPLAAYAARLDLVDLLKERGQVDDHAVADHRDAVAGQHTGRELVQGVLLIADDDRVTGVVAALVPDDVLDLVPEQVGGLALPLVTPLRTDYHDGGHLLTPFTH